MPAFADLHAPWDDALDAELAGEDLALPPPPRAVPPEVAVAESVHTSALELQDLFDCQRFGPLTHRACLRRQLERQESTTSGVEGPPVRPHCALACEQGRAIRTGLAHVPAQACAKCGTALVGADAIASCSTCAARKAEHQVQQRTPPKVAAPTHLWAEQLPEPPFVPPKTSGGPHDAGAGGKQNKAASPLRPPPAAAAPDPHGQGDRNRTIPTAAVQARAVNPELKETPMAEPIAQKVCPCGRKVRRSPDGAVHDKCSACRGTSSSLKPKNGAKASPATKPAVTAVKPSAAAKPPVSRPAAKPHATPVGLPDRELAGKSVDDLVALRNRIMAELHRRQAEAEETARKLREVLGEAA